MRFTKTLILLLFFCTQVVQASTQAIYWQKLMLEEKVQHKISNSLGTVLANNQYLVDVEAEVDEPSAPNFGNNNSSGPRVSDLNLSDSRGDYIAFSKVGLEVPVLDKYLDEEKTKLMNLYRFNEAYDVFKNLQSVKVTVYLSESLAAPLAEIAEKVVKSTRLSLGTIKPNFKFEKMALEWIDPKLKEKMKAAENKKPEEPKEPKIWAKDWLEWASRWGNGFGLILSALIVTFLALTLFKKWKEFMESFNKHDEEKSEEDSQQLVAGEQKKSEEEEESLEDIDMTSDNGFERFKMCLTQYPIEASNVSRDWLSQNSNESRLALRAVAQQLSSEEFATLLGTLGQDQREMWKSIIGSYLGPTELKDANKIIARDVLKALLVPSRVKDVVLLNQLVELGATKITQFLNKNEAHAAVIFNLLSPSVTSSIIDQITDQKAENWLTAAATFDISQIETAADELKKAITDFQRGLSPSHFNSRLAELIVNSSPSKERMLYKSLAKSSGPEEVVRVGQRMFPSELILELPELFLKETLQGYPMAKRIELLISLNEDDRMTLLSSFAEEGSTARELMDMEIESISNDTAKVSMIQNRAEEIWKEYVQFSRKNLENSPQYKVDAEKILTNWANKISKNLTIVGSESAA